MSFGSKYKIVSAACLLIIFVVMAGCAKKIVDTGRNVNVTVSIDSKMLSPGAIDVVDHFELIVEGEDFGSLVEPMFPADGLITAEVEVPAGRARKFIVRAKDKENTVLYEGNAIADVVRGERLTLDINLFPVIPMVNITPHYQYIMLNDTFFVDIYVHNLHELNSLTLNFTRSDSPTEITTVVRGRDFGDNVNFWYEAGAPYGTVAIHANEMTITSPIVDVNGYAHLATIGFRSYRDWVTDTATVIMTMQLTEAGFIAGNVIPLVDIKTDAAVVELYWPDTLVASTWEKTLGGVADDIGHSNCNAHDGNLIVAGTTSSSGAGLADVILAKIDLEGNVLWEKTFGGSANDEAYCVSPTNDGGYMISGSSESFSLDDFPPDLYLIKTDAFGNLEWEKTYGIGAFEIGYSVAQTEDAGYLVAGLASLAGGSHVYVIKTDQNGDSLWGKTYSANQFNWGRSIIIATDGNYVIAGSTSGLDSPDDVCLTFINTGGGLIRQMTHGGSGIDQGNDISPTIDGGYIIIGNSNSTGAGMDDVYAVKTTSLGQFSWSKTYGFAGNDYGYSIEPTRDQGFIIAGCTQAVGSPSGDVYLIKTASNGSTNWYTTFGGAGDDVGYSVMRTSDGGFFVVGYTDSFGAGNKDIYLIKTDADGKVAPSAFSKSTGIIKRFEKS